MLAVLLALGDGGVRWAVVILVVVVLVQNAMQNLVQPRIRRTPLGHTSPLAVLLATTFGGVAAGLIGLILAVPFTAIACEAVRIARRPLGAEHPGGAGAEVPLS